MAACSEQMAPQADLNQAELDHQSAAPHAPAAAQASANAPVTDAGEAVVPAGSEIPMNLAQLDTSSAAEPIPHESAEELRGGELVAAGLVTPGYDIPAEATEASPGASAANITEVNGTEGEEEMVESVGGADAMEEVPERMPRLRRQYKIQEVIKRRQVMLVQVVKEERGTKGAALTSYLSLAGRYSVLMPNTARGGGISRKITSADDRRRLKEIAQDLEVPEGMGVILRTAGASRTKTEVKRDFEYLLRLWETVRDLTLKSTAPKLVYEEGSLVKRSIRDLYNKDIDEILVAGEVACQEAKEFMRMLMPSHAKNVKPYRDGLPIFTRHGIESQLDAMFTPVMQLRSGGYIVLNQAEALVAIDVNSGRATREHHIEDTALKTNLEAAEEIARQLRLRDLAGLIVIDFIDMDEKRNNRAVERRLKECLRHDRARIQVGHISHFGLLEMSRQRIRSSVLESSTEKCPHCGGTGHVRSVASVALQVLRSLEEMLLKGATHNLTARTRSEIALYLLNHKRAHLRALEERFRIAIMVNADPSMGGQITFLIEKGEQVHSLEQAKALAAQAPAAAPTDQDQEDDQRFEDDDEAPRFDDVAAVPSDGELALATQNQHDDDDQVQAEGQDQGQDQGQGRKRRRRRRGRRGGEGRDDGAVQREPSIAASPAEQSPNALPDDPDAGGDFVEHTGADAGGAAGAESAAELNGEGERPRRRRGRRGGRRNRRERDGDVSSPEIDGIEPDLGRAAPDLEVAPPPVTQMQPWQAASEPQPDLPAHAEGHAQAHAPDPQAAGPDLSATTPSEPARRRSTVRESALTAVRAPATEPAPTDTTIPVSAEPAAASAAEGDNGDRPRRSGWWSKRLLGH
jgi:ribonuclease E